MVTADVLSQYSPGCPRVGEAGHHINTGQMVQTSRPDFCQTSIDLYSSYHFNIKWHFTFWVTLLNLATVSSHSINFSFFNIFLEFKYYPKWSKMLMVGKWTLCIRSQIQLNPFKDIFSTRTYSHPNGGWHVWCADNRLILTFLFLHKFIVEWNNYFLRKAFRRLGSCLVKRG